MTGNTFTNELLQVLNGQTIPSYIIGTSISLVRSSIDNGQICRLRFWRPNLGEA